ncbi:CIC11C00000005569 [Sungouiella intermedia]|uniref:CIC11C00000005569 n=1 Tax=Sungouiella intermedia TaxID=45354 RepID=A0A1L0DL92_9ASCO|nr:CIC11C00000005569 [[Candida] intermedia]
MSGSFWKLSNGITSLSNISTILENFDINHDVKDTATVTETLVKLLEESDLLQELMSNNSQLLEFLRNDVVINMLVDLLISENDPLPNIEESFERLSLTNDKSADDNRGADDSVGIDRSISEEEDEKDDDSAETPEARRTRHAALASEILSADVWSLTDTVMESTSNLNKLWSILDLEAPLTINLATYFMKIMEHLLDMKCEEMISYLIDNQPTLVEKFMKHLANPPLMDFLLKLISTDKPDNSTGIIDFLQDQSLISYLIDALDISEAPAEEQEEYLVKQSSAADFLKALITISANSTTDNSTIGPNELTRELVSKEMMTRLCNTMLKGGYALGNGVGIIIEIIRKNNSDYDILPVLYITLESHPPTGRDPIYLGHLLEVFGSKIQAFNMLLMSTGEEAKLKTTFGEIEPLGFERFKICELIAELLHCSNMALLNDNKGYDAVSIRDDLRQKLKEIDGVGFKYNEVIDVSEELLKPFLEKERELSKKFDNEVKPNPEQDDDYNDTIDSFNSKLQEQSNFPEGDDEEPHANANLTEEQIRGKPVVGDYLKIALYDTQIVSNILSMFFKFPWNNFLHNVVFDIVQQVLNGSMDIGFNKFLAIDIFHSGDITFKITEGQRLCNEYELQNYGLRLGYMGHLTLIAEEVVKFIQLYPVSTVSHLIDEKVEGEVWENYVSVVLYDTRKKYNAILGGSDIDDDEGSNTFDESGSELMEEGDIDSGLALDADIDHDLIEYEQETKEEEFREDVDIDHEDDDVEEEEEEDEEERTKEARFNSSDDSESEDDDDHFSSYMSLQLTNSGTGGFATSLHNKAKEFGEQESHSYQTNDYLLSSGDDDDDYIDPNDDGMSYKKANPLYDSHGILMNDLLRYSNDDHLLSEDSSSSSDSDDDIEDELVEEKTNKLTRAASKG